MTVQVTEDIVVGLFAEAIARKEGFYKQNKIPMVSQKTNNPGNLPRRRYSKWVTDPTTKMSEQKWLPYPEQNGFTVFPVCERPNCMHNDHPCEIGWRSLREQCASNIFKRGLTFLEFFQGKREGKKTIYMGFSPSANKTDPYAYANEVMAFIKRKLSLPEETSLHTVIASIVYPQSAPQPMQQPRQRQWQLPVDAPIAGDRGRGQSWNG